MKVNHCYKSNSTGDITITCDADLANEIIYNLEKCIDRACTEQDYDKVQDLSRMRKLIIEAMEEE